MARPKLSSSSESVRLNVMVPALLLTAVDAWGLERGQSRSEAIRLLLAAGLDDVGAARGSEPNAERSRDMGPRNRAVPAIVDHRCLAQRGSDVCSVCGAKMPKR